MRPQPRAEARLALPALLALAAALLAAGFAAAQPTAAPETAATEPSTAAAPEASTAAPPAAADPSAVAEAAADEGPVPVPEPSELARRYYRTGNVLWAVATLWGLAVPLLLLFTGFSARLRSWAQRLGRRWVPTFVLYVALFTLVGFLLDLPLAYYADFVRQHAYGLSNQTPQKWWSDAWKGLAISVVAGVLTFWIPFALIRWSPRRWWLYTGLAAVPVLVLLLFVTPIWIEPLFNEFGPMKDKALEGRILDLAQRSRIEGARVFEVEKSVDTETVNAYVTGIGDTKRIVLWDTLLRKLEPRETLFVMGHEMGHYVLGHVPKTIALIAALIMVGMWVVHRSADRLIARYGPRFGFDRLGDVASLPLIFLLGGLAIFVVTPLALAYSRYQEHEADRFGLEITHDNRGCATAFVKLQQENLGNPRPGPLYKIWRSSHPPLGERIDFCNAYRPWAEGRPPRYGDRFKTAG